MALGVSKIRSEKAVFMKVRENRCFASDRRSLLSRMSHLVILLLSVACCLKTVQAAPIDSQQVNEAIDRGVAYLKRVQSPRGRWFDLSGQADGVTALCTLALLNAGVPPEDPTVQKALGELRRQSTNKTYATALKTMVFCIAEPEKDLVLIRRNVKWLERVQKRDGKSSGAWSYGENSMAGDNSNSQFAILALHEAERAGVAVDQDTWRRAMEYWQRTQNPNGSWGYTPGAPGTGSMTCAGVAAAVITSIRLAEQESRVEGNQVICCGARDDRDTIARGLDWLGRNFSVQRNPGRDAQAGRERANWVYYYLYGLERVGRLTAQRLIGGHDWYREGAERLVRDQDKLSGFWKSPSRVEEHPHIGTSLALLFLSKGRRPVVIARLMHGPGDDWNHHRAGLTQLTAYTEQRWQRDLTWQVIDPKTARTEDLLLAPVLLVNGSQAPQLTARDKRNLRDYVDRGGFLFGEACCDGEAFDRGFRQLMEEIFPEPEYRLRLLPPDHPIWHAEERVNPDYLRPLWGIDYGCRTSVVYCPQDLSCYWELGGRKSNPKRQQKIPIQVRDSVQAAQAIGVNVLTYATGREPKFKQLLPSQLASEQNDQPAIRGTLQVAKLLHGGGCNVAPGAVANLLRQTGRELAFPVDRQPRELLATDPQLSRYHLVFMHGRRKFRFTPAERQALRVYLERGGTLFADAICASREFAGAFREEMRAVLPDVALERIPAGDPIFTDAFGGYSLAQVTRRDPARRAAGGPLKSRLRKVSPDLEAIRIGDRYGVIFSPYDISCALEQHASLECQGYVRDDAAKIGVNVLMYSLQR